MEIEAVFLDDGEVCALGGQVKGKKWHFKDCVPGKSVVAPVPTHALFVREVKLAVDKLSLAKKALPFQLEGLFPKDLESYVIVPIFYKVDGIYHVTVHACEQEVLKNQHQLYEKRGIIPLQLTSMPQALYQFFLEQVKDVGDLILLDFMEKSSSLLYITQRRLRACVSIDLGWAHLKQEKMVESYQTKLKRSLYFLENRFGVVHHVLFTGKFSQSGLSSVLVGDKEVIQVEGSEKALLIGLCMDAVSPMRVQFLVHNDKHLSVSKKQILALKKKVCCLLMATLVLGCLAILGWKRQKSALLEKVSTLARDLSAEKDLLQAGSIEKKLDQLGSYFIDLKKDQRYFATPPRVSSALDWLSSLEPFQSGRAELQAFFYDLHEYPKVDNKVQDAVVEIGVTVIAEESVMAQIKEMLVEDQRVLELLRWEDNGHNCQISFSYKNA